MAPQSSNYAHIRRSTTMRQRPFIDLDPVQGSLTDGTNIPPPAADPDPETEPFPKPPTDPPIKEKLTLDAARAVSHSASASGGPLKSHPVTPIDTPPAANTPPTNGASTSNARQAQHAGTENTRPPTSGTDMAGVEQGKNSRRSSFASRFFRFRSLSSLRNRNASQLTLAQNATESRPPTQQGGGRKSGDMMGGTTRGTKRPASPNPAEALARANGGQQGTSQSFPRMMRKRSMDLFGTARRKSGLWSSSQMDLTQSAMDEEARREREREAGENGPAATATTGSRERPGSRMSTDNGGRSSRMSFSGRSGRRYSSLTRRSGSMAAPESVVREPAPMLPEIQEITELEGEDLFKNIGRE